MEKFINQHLLDRLVIRTPDNTECVNWTEFEIDSFHIDDNDIRYTYIYRYENRNIRTVGSGVINIDSFVKKIKIFIQNDLRFTIKSFFGNDKMWHATTKTGLGTLGRVGDSELEVIVKSYNYLRTYNEL